MTADLIWKALLLGMLNAAPIGPVGLMCLRKNVEDYRLPGIMAATGMATAYGIISFCVLFGLNGISQWVNEYRMICQLAAGVCLVFMGWRGLNRTPVARLSSPSAGRLVGDFTRSFALTLLNPVPFASFALLLSSFHLVRGKLDLAADLVFAGLVFSGTILFWLLVNQGLHWIRNGAGERPCRWINQGSSVALIIFGAVIFLKGALEQSQW